MKTEPPTPYRPLFVIGGLAILTALYPVADSTNTPATRAFAPTPFEPRGYAMEVAPSPKLHTDPDRPALRALLPPADAGHSPLADQLLAPEHTGGEDTRVVFTLFEQYRKRFGTYPTGEDNASFVNALTGNNPGRLPLLDPVHSAINAKGEICDRWGTPFFFHLIASDAIEVRSAGPDRVPYSTDDFVMKSEKTELVRR
jgi:hypothetical protein